MYLFIHAKAVKFEFKWSKSEKIIFLESHIDLKLSWGACFTEIKVQIFHTLLMSFKLKLKQNVFTNCILYRGLAKISCVHFESGWPVVEPTHPIITFWEVSIKTLQWSMWCFGSRQCWRQELMAKFYLLGSVSSHSDVR